MQLIENPALPATVLTALDAGDIVVLCCNRAHTIADARNGTRSASAWLHTLTSLRAGRLCRSATAGLGVVAAHKKFVVGVDVEVLGSDRNLRDMANTLLHDDEREALLAAASTDSPLTHAWVRKEATLKAFGVGLAVSPGGIATGAYNPSWQAVSHGVLGTALVRSVAMPNNFALALALLGALGAEVRLFGYSMH